MMRCALHIDPRARRLPLPFGISSCCDGSGIGTGLGLSTGGGRGTGTGGGGLGLGGGGGGGLGGGGDGDGLLKSIMSPFHLTGFRDGLLRDVSLAPWGS